MEEDKDNWLLQSLRDIGLVAALAIAISLLELWAV
jgi:hypothetical protein